MEMSVVFWKTSVSTHAYYHSMWGKVSITLVEITEHSCYPPHRMWRDAGEHGPIVLLPPPPNWIWSAPGADGNILLLRLFANDVIIIGSVRADWPAPINVTIGNPRADKLGRNGFACNGRRCYVDRERCVRSTFMHSAIENYSRRVYASLTTMVGVARNKKIRNEIAFMILSHNSQSCMCRH